MEIFFTILILTLIVPISGILHKIVYILPLPLLQIFIGILLAIPKFGLHIDFNPELFLVLFIPPLLFFDGLNINLKDFFYNGIEIIFLSLFLVFITIIILGILIYNLIPNTTLIQAFMLSSVLSPTDAVALMSLIGKKIPKKIMDVLEGEALMNDASGLSSLKCSIAISSGYMIFTLSNITKEFIKVSIGGIFVGILVTVIYNIILKLIKNYNADDEMIQTIFLLILPFISYLSAEHFGLSGILSSVISGMTINKFKLIGFYDSKIELKSNNIWKTLEFILNGIVFIMLGLQLPIILKNIINDLVCKNKFNFLIVLFLKILTIYIFLILLRFLYIIFLNKISKNFMSKDKYLFLNYNIYEILIVSFSGVRGSITLAGVLSIPIFIINNNLRNIFIFISAIIILISFIVGIIILPIFIKKNNNICK